MHPQQIAVVRSPLKNREECPKSADRSLPPVWIDIDPLFADAATDLQKGDHLVLLSWLHLAETQVQRCHPRGDKNLPVRGIFSTRSPDRPTPIGLHHVQITARQGLSVQVHPLELLDQTPIVDIKPDIKSSESQTFFPALVPPVLGTALLQTGRDGWQRELFSGINGNISVRQNSRVIITATGSAKGHLRPQDLSVISLGDGTHQGGPPPSSELAVHLEIYRQQPKAQAIVHTHPPHLLTLFLRGKTLQDLPLFEGQVFSAGLALVPPLQPGSSELAILCGQKARQTPSVFLEEHGLICWEESLAQALSLSEELESLAKIALLTGH